MLKSFKYLFFPEYCSGCDILLHPNEKSICIKCLHNIPYTDFHLHKNNLLTDLFYERLDVKHATSLCYFNKGNVVQKIIHNLKFHKHRKTAEILGEILAYKLKKTPFYNNISFIVPIPLHNKRQIERGYNQSEMFAKGISNILQIPLDTELLFRNKYSKPQTLINYTERIENVENIFLTNNKLDYSNKTILLVDDVVTSGATL
ncbi:MAG: hypothetical protein A2X12_02900, partial [Bacteroidetes bacterium GWE2_29_8]